MQAIEYINIYVIFITFLALQSRATVLRYHGQSYEVISPCAV